VTGNSITIGYNEGNVIEDSIKKKGSKISYHASGVVNFVTSRFSIDKLRDLSENKLIATLLFEELAKFAIIPKKES
jgi:hypothetical protein